MRFALTRQPMRATERARVTAGVPVPSRRRVAGGFTLVEVLAALLFMALVIPVAVDGLRVASRASVVGQRKSIAARIAQQVLNEQVVAGQGLGAAVSGVTRESNVDYAWMVKQEVWSQSQAQS